MKKYLSIICALALAFVACNKQETSSYAPAELNDEIVFTMAATRGADPVTTENLGDLYVSATTGSSSEAQVNGFTNVTFSKTNNEWKGGKYWPETDPGYHFYLSNSQLTYAAGGATISPSNANSDIVTAYVASPTHRAKTNVELGHIFAQVGTVSMKAPAGWAVTNMKVSLQPVVSGTFNVKSNTWTNRGNAQSAVYILGTASNGVQISTEANNATYTGSDNDLWLLPGSYVLTASYTISKGDYSKVVNGVSCTVQLVQGRNNNIGPVVSGGVEQPNITPPGDIAEIVFGVTVTPWSDNHVNANF